MKALSAKRDWSPIPSSQVMFEPKAKQGWV